MNELSEWLRGGSETVADFATVDGECREETRSRIGLRSVEQCEHDVPRRDCSGFLGRRGGEGLLDDRLGTRGQRNHPAECGAARGLVCVEFHANRGKRAAVKL